MYSEGGGDFADTFCKSFYIDLAAGQVRGPGLSFKSETGSPTVVIGAQIKSRNAKIKRPICLTTIFLVALRHAVFPLVAWG